MPLFFAQNVTASIFKKKVIIFFLLALISKKSFKHFV